MSFGSRGFGSRDLAVNVLPVQCPGPTGCAAQTACPGPTNCATESGCAHPSLCQPPSDCPTESAGHTTAHCTTTQDAGRPHQAAGLEALRRQLLAMMAQPGPSFPGTSFRGTSS